MEILAFSRLPWVGCFFVVSSTLGCTGRENAFCEAIPGDRYSNLLKVGGRPGVEMCSFCLRCLVLGWEISAEGTHTLREQLRSTVPDCMCCDQLELQSMKRERTGGRQVYPYVISVRSPKSGGGKSYISLDWRQ